ncbi:MAG TPA: hypothetical protein VFW12_02955 [Candidatus Limnocylindria bacterium]|nr:hypothetical protein [Candidatus Limnocylindria bacterium]
MRSARVAVLGGEPLRGSVIALGLEPREDGAVVALVDLRDPGAVARAAALDRAVPRVVVAGEPERHLASALGIDPSRIVASHEPAVLGPALMSALPLVARAPTRTVLVTGVRGGVGTTLLATNLSRRIAGTRRVCLVDGTGSGAAAWWLGCSAGPWPELEGLVDELTADHLAVVATEAATDLRLIGGAPAAPSRALLAATVRAATALSDLVIVDAPPLTSAAARDLAAQADRHLLLAYDDPCSRATLASLAPADDVWLVASQSNAARLDERAVFRSLPRDESSVAGAMSGRRAVGGALGTAYDRFAELLLIDGS